MVMTCERSIQESGQRNLCGGHVVCVRQSYEEVFHGPIPRATLHALISYASKGCPVGDFLYAVLSNNLKEAVARADVQNADALTSIVGFIYNQLPGSCWGSEEAVAKWLDRSNWVKGETRPLPDLKEILD